ncbi:hypothetical protein [Streptomyces sp. NPDC001588]
MAELDKTTLSLMAAQEQLRQEQETFNQIKEQDAKWFRLRLAMGYVAAFLLPLICALCTWILVNHKDFTSGTVSAATVTLLVDTAGLVFSVYKVVLNKGPQSLGPITKRSTRG